MEILNQTVASSISESKQISECDVAQRRQPVSNSARLQLGFSPLSKTIMLAKMRDVEGGRMRVGNDPGRDVTNEAAQLVWRLVMTEGGEIAWELDDGSHMVLKAEKQGQPVSKIDYQKLREIAEKTKIAGEAPVMPFDQRINALNDFMKHFSPDIALALLDERERNQQYIKLRDQENEDIALTVGKLRVELEAAEKRIAELEAREISLPERSSMLHRTDFHDDYQTVMAYKVSEVIDAIRATGIRIKGE